MKVAKRLALVFILLFFILSSALLGCYTTGKRIVEDYLKLVRSDGGWLFIYEFEEGQQIAAKLEEKGQQIVSWELKGGDEHLTWKEGDRDTVVVAVVHFKDQTSVAYRFSGFLSEIARIMRITYDCNQYRPAEAP